VVCSEAALKCKLGEDVMMQCLDGKAIPFERASGMYAIVEFRIYANASKSKTGTNTSAFIGCSIVAATQLEETATSLRDLPLFEGVNAGEPRFSVPTAGSGATRSPDVIPTAAEQAAADAAERPLVRGRSDAEEPASAAAKTASASAGATSAPRTRARAE